MTDTGFVRDDGWWDDGDVWFDLRDVNHVHEGGYAGREQDAVTVFLRDRDRPLYVESVADPALIANAARRVQAEERE